MARGVKQKMKTELLTDFDVFNYVKNHLLAQNTKSQIAEENTDVNEISNIFCAYRSPDGLSCAIGCLIEDKHYSFRLEKTSVSDLAVSAAVIKSIPNWEFNEQLLTDLQYVHDIVNVEKWEAHLTILSSNFNSEGSYLRKGEDE